jgi:hypothetical protein
MDYYFIHNYKTAGTTIISQLDDNYKNRYYGFKTFREYVKKNPNVNLNLELDLLHRLNFSETGVSIDHIHIDTLIYLNIIEKRKIPKTSFMMIIRNPIERFLSICNFDKISPKALIEKLENGIGDNFFQYKLINNNHGIKVKLFKLENKLGIKKWFSNFNQNINLNQQKNVSKKLYTYQNLSKFDLEFLKNFYKKDFELYNNAN